MVEEEERKKLFTLKASLIEILGKKKALKLIEKIQSVSESRLGQQGSIQVIEQGDIEEILQKLWDQGIIGIGRADLLKIDSHLNQERLKQKAMLRFLKYYLEPEEYNSIQLSVQLTSLISDKHSTIPQRHKMIKGLYEKLNKQRYGRQIFNLFSSGKIPRTIYPKMRELECSFVEAGRACGPESEAVKQIFYSSLQYDPKEMWIRGELDDPEIFGKIIDRIFYSTPTIPYLNVHSAGSAQESTKEAIELFVALYPEYTYTEHPQKDNPEAGFLKIFKK